MSSFLTLNILFICFVQILDQKNSSWCYSGSNWSTERTRWYDSSRNWSFSKYIQSYQASLILKLNIVLVCMLFFGKSDPWLNYAKLHFEQINFAFPPWSRCGRNKEYFWGGGEGGKSRDKKKEGDGNELHRVQNSFFPFWLSDSLLTLFCSLYWYTTVCFDQWRRQAILEPLATDNNAMKISLDETGEKREPCWVLCAER